MILLNNELQRSILTRARRVSSFRARLASGFPAAMLG